VISAAAPTFAVATANTPVAVGPGMFTMPSPLVVAAKATISGIGVAEAEKSRVLRPELMEAGVVSAQSKLNCTSVGAIGPVGVRAKTKFWAAPGGMVTGVLAVPVTWLVAWSVV